MVSRSTPAGFHAGDRAPSALWFFTLPAWLMSTRVPVCALMKLALTAGAFLILGFRLSCDLL